MVFYVSFHHKPIVFFCAFFLLLKWSCSKDPDLVPKIDYRDAFLGTYEVNFTMYSSSSYLLQTPLRHTGVSVERCVVRKAVESDANGYGQWSSGWRTRGIVISNVAFLQPEDGRKYNTTWYVVVDNAGDASPFGDSWGYSGMIVLTLVNTMELLCQILYMQNKRQRQEGSVD